MRHCFTFFIALAIVSGVQAQNITGYEYWFDDGFASRAQITLPTPDAEFTLSVVDASALSDGLHTFHFRAVDSNGAWSAVSSQVFYKITTVAGVVVRELTAYQFWFDDGFAASAATTLSPPVDEFTLSAVDAVACSEGMHTLHFRALDDTGEWSTVASQAFYRIVAPTPAEENKINGFRYWFNDRIDEAKYVTLGKPVNPLELDSALQVSARLADRRHGFHIQFSDLKDQWSVAASDSVLVKGGALTVTLDEKDLLSREYYYTTLELKRQVSDQTFYMTISDNPAYTFDDLPAGVYRLTLTNDYGDLLGELDDIRIYDNIHRKLTLNDLKGLRTVRIRFSASGVEKLPDQPSVRWFSASGEFMCAGDSIIKVPVGARLSYLIDLGETLGRMYLLPARGSHTVVFGDNTIDVELGALPRVTITGLVRGENAGALPYATVTVSQLLNGGRYNVAHSSKTDGNGKFEISIFNDSTSVIVSHTGYFNRSVTKSNFDESADLGVIVLQPTVGAVIALRLSHTASVAAGEKPDVKDGYTNYRNVNYSLFNITKGQEITGFEVVYPEIVVDAGEIGEIGETEEIEIRVTATSRTGEFEPVICKVVIGKDLRGVAHINILARGYIRAIAPPPSSSASPNNLIAILYDASGELIKRYTYKKGTVDTDALPDGTYSIVTMHQSDYFNSLTHLAKYTAVGLVQGKDYILNNNVPVRSGEIAGVQVSGATSAIAEEQYYTGAKTVYSVERTVMTVLNYQTFRAEIDFREAYRNSVKNIRLIADIPENCEFTGSGVMVDDKLSKDYSVVDRQIFIPLKKQTDVVRFCMIPSVSGEFAPSAYVEFEYDGKTIRQPIGAARFTVEELTIHVPRVTAQKEIAVYGAAPEFSKIKIYDGDILIGETQALENGMWWMRCNLHQPHATSTHYVHAKAHTPHGAVRATETKEVTHVVTAITVSKVTMYNTAQIVENMDLCEYVTEFDFLNPSTIGGTYWYWREMPTFSFTISFTLNDPAIISNVLLRVFTTSGAVTTLPAVWDDTRGLWVAAGDFGSANLPVNVNVDFASTAETLFDSRWYNEGIVAELTDIMGNIGQGSLYEISTPTTPAPVEVIEYLAGMDDADLYALIAEAIGKVMVIINDWEKINAGLVQSANTYSMYGTRDISLGNGGKATVTTTSCSGMNEKDFQNGAYVRIPTTTGQFIYMKSSENEYILVDFDRGIYRTVRIETAGKMSQKTVSANDWKRIKTTLDYVLLELSAIVGTDRDNYDAAVAKYNTDLQSLYDQDQNLANDLAAIGKKLETATGAQKTELETQKAMIDSKRTDITQALSLHVKYGEFLKRIPEYLFITTNVQKAYEDARKHCDRIDALESNIPEEADASEEALLKTDIDGLRARMVTEYTGAVARIAGLLHSGSIVDPANAGTLALVIAEGQYEFDHVARFNRTIDNGIKAIESDIVAFGLKNSGSSTENSESHEPGPCPPARGNLDPSGYVYEAVPSNRLPGVTATIYKETSEAGVGIVWDAKSYAQENPIVTNTYGMYGWSVPQGLWQVKYERNGYRTMYSDWLNIPPPQLDINTGIVQNTQPFVRHVQGFEEGLDVEFDKFMQPATLTGALISVTRNGAAEQGTIMLLNSEANPVNPAEQFASKLTFIPSKKFATTDVVILIVRRAVKSYAGIAMSADYEQRIPIQKKASGLTVTQELDVVLHEEGYIDVTATPDMVLSGKPLTARAVSSSIATVTGIATLDATGKARLKVTGDLPGATVVYVTIDGTDLKANSTVKVSIPEPKITVSCNAMPFGNVLIDESAPAQTVTAGGSYITGSLRFNMTGDVSAFAFTETMWSSTNGGSLSIEFTPTQEKIYSAQLEISSPGTTTQKVLLSGKGVKTLTDPKPVTKVTLNKNTLDMQVDGVETLVATVLPTDADDPTITWSSSDQTVATVNNGTVKALKIGTAKITAQAHNGIKDECSVNVKATVVNVTGVTLDPTALEMKVGKTETLVATVLPATAADKTVTWTSSDATVATVTNGTVTALKAGKTTITVNTNDGAKTATCAVTVTAVTGVETLRATSLQVYPNPTDGRLTLVFPEDGNYRVSIVDATGKIVWIEMVTGKSYQMDISGYPNGVYLMTVEKGKEKVTVRVVKE